MDPRNGLFRAGLTSVLVVLLHTGGVEALHKEDGVDGDGRVASRVPRRCQRHLEVDPGLARGDEHNDHHARQSQHQAQLAGDLLGLIQ